MDALTLAKSEIVTGVFSNKFTNAVSYCLFIFDILFLQRKGQKLEYRRTTMRELYTMVPRILYRLPTGKTGTVHDELHIHV